MLVEVWCRCGREVTGTYDQADRKVEGPDALKATLLISRGWSYRAVAEKLLHCSSAYVAVMGYGGCAGFRRVIEEWKDGKIVRESATLCSLCIAEYQQKREEIESWRTGRKLLKEVKAWIRSKAPCH